MLISNNLLLNHDSSNASSDLPIHGYYISNVWLKAAETLAESPLLDDALHLVEVMCKKNIYPTTNVLEKVIQRVSLINSPIHSFIFTHSSILLYFTDLAGNSHHYLLTYLPT